MAIWQSLSANTRQKIRRLLKQVDTPGEYRITIATPETFTRDLKTLLGFWETKWRPRKGKLIDGLVQLERRHADAQFSVRYAVHADFLAR